MIQQLLHLYQLIDNNAQVFTGRNLSANFFMDVYRSQPLEPELYEYFNLPAIFVDYSMTGQGKNQPRLVTMTLHVVLDELPDASNISECNQTGMNRFLYLLLLQKIIEGKTLGNTSHLRFIAENIVDAPVINYHTQTYEFEVYVDCMLPNNPDIVFGEFEHLNIYPTLRQRR